MGYRLSIEDKNNKCIFYGSKYYGYVGDDPDEMLEFGSKSCKYLLNKKMIDYDTTFWEYGISNRILMKQNEILRFIKLYIEDIEDYGYPINSEVIDDLFESYLYIKDNKDNYYICWE